MKKIFVIFFAMMFVASLSLSVVGCTKAEEPTPTPAPEVKAPAPGTSGLPGAPAKTAPAKSLP